MESDGRSPFRILRHALRTSDVVTSIPLLFATNSFEQRCFGVRQAGLPKTTAPVPPFTSRLAFVASQSAAFRNSQSALDRQVVCYCKGRLIGAIPLGGMNRQPGEASGQSDPARNREILPRRAEYQAPMRGKFRWQQNFPRIG